MSPKWLLLTVYNESLDSLMTSKNASLGPDKKLNISQFRYILPFSENVRKLSAGTELVCNNQPWQFTPKE